MGTPVREFGGGAVVLDKPAVAPARNGRNCTYYHNGQTCQRIGSADRRDAELEDVCDSLRERVAQVAERE
jgi:hypothetical protein